MTNKYTGQEELIKIASTIELLWAFIVIVQANCVTLSLYNRAQGWLSRLAYYLPRSPES